MEARHENQKKIRAGIRGAAGKRRAARDQAAMQRSVVDVTMPGRPQARR